MIGHECVINMSEEVHINDALMWGYEREGSFRAHTWGVATSGKVGSWMDHACWTTGGEVRRIGLRVGRYVEVVPQANMLVEAW